jgi:hypothetical protein
MDLETVANASDSGVELRNLVVLDYDANQSLKEMFDSVRIVDGYSDSFGENLQLKLNLGLASSY